MDFMKSRMKIGKPRVGQKCRQLSGGNPCQDFFNCFCPFSLCNSSASNNMKAEAGLRITKGNLESVVPNPTPDISFSVGLEEDEELAVYQLLYCAFTVLCPSWGRKKKLVTGNVPENQLPPFLSPSLHSCTLPFHSILPISLSPSIPPLAISLPLSHQFPRPLLLSLKAQCNFPVC